MKKLIDKDHNFIDEPDGDDESLKGVSSRAVQLMDEIEMRELELDQMKKELRTLQTEILPNMMVTAGSSTFTTLDGYRLEHGTLVEGSLPKDPHKRAEAVTFLEANGAGDLIKTDVVIPFSKEQHRDALKLLTQLRQRGLDPRMIADCHHMTLKAWARERLANGEDVPGEKLGLFIAPFVSIAKQSAPKKSKKR